MSFRFSIYSTDNVDPDLATDSTSWGPDPSNGEYDPHFEWTARASQVKTLGGLLFQDYGFKNEDRKIRIAGQDIGETIAEALRIKYLTKDVEWNFTDGLGEVFRIRFSKQPMGFSAVRNFHLYAVGLNVANPPPSPYIRYNYEIVLLVTQQLV